MNNIEFIIEASKLMNDNGFHIKLKKNGLGINLHSRVVLEDTIFYETHKDVFRITILGHYVSGVIFNKKEVKWIKKKYKTMLKTLFEGNNDR